MAYGSNSKRGATNGNNSTQNDNHGGNNHHIVNVPNPFVTTTTVSLPNNPRPTPNHFPNFSGTVQSFNNSEEGSQDFSRAKIKSPVTGNSFNNVGSGSQSFRDAEIRCAEESTKRIRSIFSLKKDPRVAHGGTLHSFNNIGKGSQCFDGFKLN